MFFISFHMKYTPNVTNQYYHTVCSRLKLQQSIHWHDLSEKKIFFQCLLHATK